MLGVLDIGRLARIHIQLFSTMQYEYVESLRGRLCDECPNPNWLRRLFGPAPDPRQGKELRDP